MSTAHTPGPWRIDSSGDGTPIILGLIAKAPGVNGWEFVAHPYGINGRKEANARLIAAAPDMLAALVEAEAAALAVNRGAGETVFNPTALTIIREAIAKATA